MANNPPTPNPTAPAQPRSGPEPQRAGNPAAPEQHGAVHAPPVAGKADTPRTPNGSPVVPYAAPHLGVQRPQPNPAQGKGGPAPAPQRAPTARRVPTRGILVNEPLRILPHGPEGVGKSTFAANAPKCLIIGTEIGTAQIPVFGRVSPTCWEDVIGYVDDLIAPAPGYEEYLSVGLDSLDWLEAMCWDFVCRKHSKTSIESFGYGKGFTAALDEWRVLLARLQTLQAKRRLHVIAVAHSQLKTFKNPDANQGDYDRYQLKLNDKAAGLWKEWAEAVLFLNYERATVAVEAGQSRHRGIDTGARKLYTRMSASYDAKNRFWLPAEMTLSWGAFYREVKLMEDLRARFGAAIAGLPADQVGAIQEDIEKNDYAAAYVEYVIGLLTAPAK